MTEAKSYLLYRMQIKSNKSKLQNYEPYFHRIISANEISNVK